MNINYYKATYVTDAIISYSIRPNSKLFRSNHVHLFHASISFYSRQNATIELYIRIVHFNGDSILQTFAQMIEILRR